MPDGHGIGNAEETELWRRFLVARVRPGERVLDVGCGDGAFTDLIAEHAVQTVGTDIRPFTQWAQHPGRFVVSDAHGPLPFAELGGPPDVVIAKQSVSSFEDPIGVFRSWSEGLAPGGRVIIIASREAQRSWNDNDLDRFPLAGHSSTALLPYLLARSGFERTHVDSLPDISAPHDLAGRPQRFVVTAYPTAGKKPFTYPALAAHDGSPATIRRMESADLDAVRGLLRASFDQDFGYGYVPEWHWDVARLQETYIDNLRQAMFIATVRSPNDPRGGIIVGTAGLRIGGPNPDAVPAAVAARYLDRDRVGQLVRVVSHPSLRRSGIARRLVDAAVEFARTDRGYRTICLHTNARIPAAVPFWRSTGFVEIFDERTGIAGSNPDRRLETVHFELALL